MKKSLIAALVAAVVVGGALVPAHAGKKKAKPVTLYLHGTEVVGEVDTASNFGALYKPMTTAEPEGDAPKSVSWITWTGDPALWNNCAGSFLLPVWNGPVAGRVVGDMKVSLHTFSAPITVDVQVWPDLRTQQCGPNDTSEGVYPTPAGETTAELAPGPSATEVIIKGVDFTAVNSITLQIRPHGPLPGRVLYDAPDYASSISFKCIPTAGKSCV